PDPAGAPDHSPDDPAFRVNLVKALIPVLPMVLLFTQPLWSWRFPTVAGALATGTAMIIGTVAAALTAPGEGRKVAVTFFDGAGFAYGHVISLIICAATLTEAIVQAGLITRAAGGL